MALILDGHKLARELINKLSVRVNQLRNKYFQSPGLAIIQVGNRPDSISYIQKKKEAAEELGIFFIHKRFAEYSSQYEIKEEISRLNKDERIHGIIIQLPLPSSLDEYAILDSVSILKDVDGLHSTNISALNRKGGVPYFIPATPLACLELLDRYNIPIAGKNAVIINRSRLLGLPLHDLLLKRDATVTMCHSKTVDLPSIISRADILVSAVGRSHSFSIPGSCIKKGATIIDAGISISQVGDKRHIRGDVDFESASQVCGAISPVPCGVGPLTVAMLLSNTVSGASQIFSVKSLLKKQLQIQQYQFQLQQLLHFQQQQQQQQQQHQIQLQQPIPATPTVSNLQIESSL